MNEKENFIEKLDFLEADFSSMLSSIEPIVKERIKELAGPHYDTMQTSRDYALQCLVNPNPKLREVAIEVIKDKWAIDESVSNTLVNIANSDPVVEVRDSAIRSLGTFYGKTKNKQIGLFLATIVQSDKYEDLIRLTAYMSLLRLHGILDYYGNGPLVPQILSEIDWDFVTKYSIQAP